MDLQWIHSGFAMDLPWICNEFASLTLQPHQPPQPLQCAMDLQWIHSGFAMDLQWI
jgi:hypothetical protein